MLVRTLYDGTVDVEYAQFYVTSGPEEMAVEDPDDCFEGQVNGLCGAAVKGFLWLTTGIKSGPAGLRVELWSVAPPLGEAWEELVEVSCAFTGEPVSVQDWHGGGAPIDLRSGVYRTRYAARGMDLAHDTDTLVGGPPVDFYLLQFWPGAMTPDVILKQRGLTAAGWHRARGREVAGGQSGSEPATSSDGREREWLCDMQRLDSELLSLLEAADESALRAVAARAALRTLEVSGMTDNPILRDTVAALRQGRPAQPPFDDISTAAPIGAAWPRTAVLPIPGSAQEDRDTVDQQPYAIDAMLATVESDALRAAVEALTSAAIAHGPGYGQLFAELRKDLM